MSRGTNDEAGALRKLLAHYTRHLQGYERWLTLAEAAARRLDEDALDEFFELHEQKQGVAQKLQEEEKSLRQLRRQATEALGLEEFTLQALEEAAKAAEDEDFVRDVDAWRRLLGRLQRTMERVSKTEKSIEGKLRTYLRDLSTSASDARKTRRAVRAYHADGDDGHARFIDRKS